jgi:hypothetical protein
VGAHLDLDAMRAAKAEVLGDPPHVTIGGELYEFPPDLPFAVAEAAASDPNPRLILAKLLGEEQAASFFANDLYMSEVLKLVEWLLEDAYGTSLGELGASSPPAEPIGARSRPTSNGSITSISAKPAGDDSA